MTREAYLLIFIDITTAKVVSAGIYSEAVPVSTLLNRVSAILHVTCGHDWEDARVAMILALSTLHALDWVIQLLPEHDRVLFNHRRHLG